MGIISKVSRMPRIVSFFLVPAPGAIYLVEMQVCPVHLTVYEVRIEWGEDYGVVLIGGSQYCVTIIGVELGPGEDMGSGE